MTEATMLLHLSTWPEVEAYLLHSRGVIVPIGSTEQHGPNGMIGTDAICAEAVAQLVGEAAAALVGPTLGVGMAVHHMAFPGSMTLKPSTLVALVADCVDSLAHHGFERFFFINGHGGNIAPLRTAFSEINWRRASAGQGEVRCVIASWWENDAVARLSRELFGSAEGSHATPSEVSVVQHVYPQAVRAVAMGPAQPGSGFHGPDDYRRRYPDGRIGSDPSLASPAHGERLLTAAVAAITEQYRKFISEK
jgi:creatinine amidohydrolase